MRPKSTGRKFSQLFASRFLLHFLLSAIILTTAILTFIYQEFLLETHRLQTAETVRLELATNSLAHHFHESLIDLSVLSQSIILEDYLKNKNTRNLRRLQQEFAVLGKTSSVYDQIRLIDSSGMEKVRVNFENGIEEIVAEHSLQNKSNRYYFNRTQKLAKGNFLISPMDLNVEHGKIEYPYKPMIRFSTPITYDTDEGKPAVLIINFKATHMLADFSRTMTNSWGDAMILNPQGFWLFQPKQAVEWGFMWHNDNNFSTKYPLAWKEIVSSSNGDISNKKGLFIYRTFLPSSVSYVKSGLNNATAHSENWKIVTYIEADKLRFLNWNFFRKNRLSYFLLALAVASLSALYSWLKTSNYIKAKAIQTKELRYHNLFENMAEGYALQEAMFDNEGNPCDFRYLEVNPGFAQILGMRKEHIIGKTMLSLTPEIEDDWVRTISKVATTGKPARLEEYGESFGRHFEISVSSPEYGLVAVLLSDITDRQINEEKLRQASTVYENTAEAIMIADSRARITSVNAAFSRVTGFSEEEVLDKNPRFLQSGIHDTEFYQKMWLAINEEGQWQGEIWNRRKNGELYPAWETITAIRNADQVVSHYVSVFSDISSIKDAEKRLSELAHRDALTGLSNRLVFNANLEQAIERANRHKSKVALLFLDLDNFKLINDTLGHGAGDSVLKVVAKRLLKNVRAQDLVSRLGGDEFTIILEEINDTNDISTLAQNIINAVSQSIALEEREVYVSTSIGISIYPDNANTAGNLAKTADAAMYRAKNSGRHTFFFYTTELTEQATQRLSKESELRLALNNNELILYYQPQIDVNSGKMVGVEALLRWQHPTMGLLLPDEFIPIAEESRLIILLGNWVIEEAIKQTAAWDKYDYSPFRVAINVSLRQLIYDNTVDQITELLKKYSVNPRRSLIEIEITESALNSSGKIIRSLKKLRDLGISVAIDDFGTGYSSLSHIKNLPVDALKIDRAFLSQIPSDKNNSAITIAIMAMGHTLNLRVVAEGIENASQLSFLLDKGCDEVQGFLFARPMKGDEISKILLAETNFFNPINIRNNPREITLA